MSSINNVQQPRKLGYYHLYIKRRESLLHSVKACDQRMPYRASEMREVELYTMEFLFSQMAMNDVDRQVPDITRLIRPELRDTGFQKLQI